MEIKVYSVDGVTYKPNGFEDSRWLARKSFTRDQLRARIVTLDACYGPVTCKVYKYGKEVETIA
jgi:hypothetical protein